MARDCVLSLQAYTTFSRADALQVREAPGLKDQELTRPLMRLVLQKPGHVAAVLCSGSSAAQCSSRAARSEQQGCSSGGAPGGAGGGGGGGLDWRAAARQQLDDSLGEGWCRPDPDILLEWMEGMADQLAAVLLSE